MPHRNEPHGSGALRALALRRPIGVHGVLALARGLVGVMGLLLIGCGGADDAPSEATAPAGSEAQSKGSESPTARARSKPSFPFAETTATSGVDFVHDNGARGEYRYPETMSVGVALLDFDGDGHLDLYALQGGPVAASDSQRPPNRLWRGRGDGTFEEVPDAAGAADRGWGVGVAVADIDGDRDLDLYVLNLGPNQLYRNDGGKFTAVDVGLDDDAWSAGAAFFDADGDLDPDLYVANYVEYTPLDEPDCRVGTLDIYCSPEQFLPATDRVYRNDGGRFVRLDTAARGDGRGMGVVAGDFDGDGRQDLYVTNDRTANHLYLATGDPAAPLDELGAELGVGYSDFGTAEGGMGIAAGDFAGTGQPGLFMTNFQKEPNRFFLADESGFFVDRSLESGLGYPSVEKVAWGIGTLDVEGDGDLDLVVGNGHVFDNAEEFVPGSAWAMPDQLFRNRGDARFDVVEFPGVPLSSRGIAVGDLDGDGDSDLVVASNGDRLRIYRNEEGSPERFLVLRLEGSSPATDAFGARVEARVGDRVLRREVASGGSFASRSDTAIALGLGERGAADAVTITWPDGSSESLTEPLDGGSVLTVRQGEGVIAREELDP